MDRQLLRFSDSRLLKLIESVPMEIQLLDGICTLDPKTLSENFFNALNVADMSIDINANVTSRTCVNYEAEIFKPQKKVLAYDLLFTHISKLYSSDIAKQALEKILDGTIYMHDLMKNQSPYCFAFSTARILYEGLPWLNLPSSPPKRLDSYLNLVRQVMEKMSNENAGALSPADILVNVAYFTKHMSDKEIENYIQNVVHFGNDQNRSNGDSIFFTISIFDKYLFEQVFKDILYPDYTKVTDNFEEVFRVQKIFAKFMSVGSPVTGMVYYYPITTINLYVENNKIMDEEFFEYMAKLNRNKCVFNWHTGIRISNCCRLESNLSELKNIVKFDSFGNGGLNIGSLKVVTLNLHRMALLSKITERPIKELIRENMVFIETLLVSQRNIIKERMAERFYTFFNNGYCNINQFFSTFGFTGLYDSYTEFNVFEEEDYIEYCRDIIGCLNDFIKEADLRHPDIAFNLEHPPVEGAASILAAKDRYYFGGDTALLANQIIPLNEEFPMATRLRVNSEIGDIISGGNMLHINIDQEMTQGAHDELLKLCLEKYGITHMALNKKFASCSNGHYVDSGNICDKCGAEVDSYITRVVGYFSKVSNWSPKRREVDFPKRQWYMFASDESNCGKQDNNNHDEIDSETGSDT